jgi:hypothetical protein
MGFRSAILINWTSNSGMSLRPMTRRTVRVVQRPRVGVTHCLCKKISRQADPLSCLCVKDKE